MTSLGTCFWCTAKIMPEQDAVKSVNGVDYHRGCLEQSEKQKRKIDRLLGQSPKFTPPRHDDVYFEGMAALEKAERDD